MSGNQTPQGAWGGCGASTGGDEEETVIGRTKVNKRCKQQENGSPDIDKRPASCVHSTSIPPQDIVDDESENELKCNSQTLTPCTLTPALTPAGLMSDDVHMPLYSPMSDYNPSHKSKFYRKVPCASIHVLDLISHTQLLK